MQKVAIIIVSFNGQKYLPDLLGSVFEFASKAIEQKVIVVDNHSTDESISWLRQNFPQVIILEQEENLGFAAANNIGIKYAVSHGSDYIMLLNQDTIVTAGYLDKLAETISADEKIATIQPKLMLYPLTDLINSLGNVIHYLGFGYTYGHHAKILACPERSRRDTRYPPEADPPLADKIQVINYCSGAACLLKVEALQKVGLFDEDLFMYHEDLDLGWRFKLAGYQNTINPESIVYHKYEFSRSIKKYYFMERNRFLVLLKNYHLLTIILILPALILMELGLFIISFKKGWWREKLKVYCYLLNFKNWRKILEKRLIIQKSRVKKEAEVVFHFSGIIKHQEVDNQLVKIFNPLFNLYWQIIKHLICW